MPAICAVAERLTDAVQRRQETPATRTEAAQEPTAASQERQEMAQGQQETSASARRAVDAVVARTAVAARTTDSCSGTYTGQL